jgi:menaquinone-9 beta-reductase
VLAGEQDRAVALAAYEAFHERHRPAFTRALRLQRLVPALPPRALALALRALAPQPLVDRAFGWYLDQAHPSFAAARAPATALAA